MVNPFRMNPQDSDASALGNANAIPGLDTGIPITEASQKVKEIHLI